MMNQQQEQHSRDEVIMQASEVISADQPLQMGSFSRKKIIWLSILAAILAGVIFLWLLQYISSLREDINYYRIKVSVLEEIYGISPKVNDTQIREKAKELTSISLQNGDAATGARFQQLQAEKKVLQEKVKQMQQNAQQLKQRLITLQSNQVQMEKYSKTKIPTLMGPNKMNSTVDVFDLLHEIEIKRRNENGFRRFLNSTYVPFDAADHYFDPKLYELLSTFYKKKEVKSLADLGCGRCEYITKLNETGIQAVGYDGSPYTQNSIVQKMDLSQMRQLGKQYDYVQSFQVGEHIFSDFEDNFIFNIANHARKGIVMSWAEIGQVGSMHLNNRNSDYIIRKVERYGFEFNKNDTMWFRVQLTKHFAKTILVFQRK